jgi:hypothetical protein
MDQESHYSTVLKWAAIITAIVALLVSGRSCHIAQNALELSQKTFLVENRPYLNVKALPDPATGSYIKASKNGEKTVRVEVFYKITNVGKTPANEIISHSTATFAIPDVKLPTKKPIIYKNLGPISLGPGESIVGTHGFNMHVAQASEVKLLIDKLRTGKFSIFDEVVFNYRSDMGDGLECSKTLEYEYTEKGHRIEESLPDVCK